MNNQLCGSVFFNSDDEYGCQARNEKHYLKYTQTVDLYKATI